MLTGSGPPPAPFPPAPVPGAAAARPPPAAAQRSPLPPRGRPGPGPGPSPYMDKSACRERQEFGPLTSAAGRARQPGRAGGSGRRFRFLFRGRPAELGAAGRPSLCPRGGKGQWERGRRDAGGGSGAAGGMRGG